MPLQQDAAPTTGKVQLVLNDKGRVAVEDKLGAAVGKVEGSVISQNAQSYTIAVSRVLLLNGNTSSWNGEQVTIPKDATDGYQVRRMNQTKTIALVAAVTVAVVGFLVTVGLKGSGSGSDPNGPGGTPGQTH